MRRLLAIFLVILATKIDRDAVANIAVEVVKRATTELGMLLVVKGDAEQERAISAKVATIVKHNRPDLFKD